MSPHILPFSLSYHFAYRLWPLGSIFSHPSSDAPFHLLSGQTYFFHHEVKMSGPMGGAPFATPPPSSYKQIDGHNGVGTLALRWRYSVSVSIGGARAEMKGRGPVRDDRPGLGRHHALHPGPGDLPSGRRSPGPSAKAPEILTGVLCRGASLPSPTQSRISPPVTKTPRVGRHTSPDGRWPDGSDPWLWGKRAVPRSRPERDRRGAGAEPLRLHRDQGAFGTNEPPSHNFHSFFVFFGSVWVIVPLRESLWRADFFLSGIAHESGGWLIA